MEKSQAAPYVVWQKETKPWAKVHGIVSFHCMLALTNRDIAAGA